MAAFLPPLSVPVPQHAGVSVDLSLSRGVPGTRHTQWPSLSPRHRAAAVVALTSEGRVPCCPSVTLLLSSLVGTLCPQGHTSLFFWLRPMHCGWCYVHGSAAAHCVACISLRVGITAVTLGRARGRCALGVGWSQHCCWRNVSSDHVSACCFSAGSWGLSCVRSAATGGCTGVGTGPRPSRTALRQAQLSSGRTWQVPGILATSGTFRCPDVETQKLWVGFFRKLFSQRSDPS